MPSALESKHTSVGLTLALTLALAVGVSLAPLPEAWRPIPSLARGPVGPQLLALVTTSSAGSKRKAVGVEPDGDAHTPQVPELPEEDAPELAVREEVDAGTPGDALPAEVAADDTLGLGTLGAGTRASALRLETLRAYYAEEADTWEFMALTRARVVWASDDGAAASCTSADTTSWSSDRG